MGRAQGRQTAVAHSRFDTVMGGARRGLKKQTFDETQLEAAAAALRRLSALPEDEYQLLEEARVILEAGEVPRGAAALRELTGMLDEDYTAAAEDALRAAGML